MAHYSTQDAAERGTGYYGTNSGSATKLFVAGATVGAVVALLMAPRTGREMRYKLRQGAQKGKEKMTTGKNMAKNAALQAVGSSNKSDSDNLSDTDREE